MNRLMLAVFCLGALAFLLPDRAQAANGHEVPLPQILASLEKGKTLLEQGDGSGCRAILRELSAKLAESPTPFNKQVRREIQYINLMLMVRLNGMGLEKLRSLIATVRAQISSPGRPDPGS